jgi:hypothetical protein
MFLAEGLRRILPAPASSHVRPTLIGSTSNLTPTLWCDVANRRLAVLYMLCVLRSGEQARVHPEGRVIPHTREGNKALLEELRAKRKAENAAKQELVGAAAAVVTATGGDAGSA